MQIRKLLKRDLKHKIEEIIQVDQVDQESVYTELTEYVVTDRIREQYRELLKAIAEAPSDPDEGVGVWISGFFGSGKSSFAKNLGYVLTNREVLGHRASTLFKERVADPQIDALVDSINARIPTEVVMFDVQKDRSQGGQGNLSISPYMYRVLLREFGYAEDFDVAELEIDLEGERRLNEFIARFNARYAAEEGTENQVWTQRGRSGTRVWNRAGVILHDMDPATYPNPESFAHSLAQNRVEVTPRILVARAFELAARRRPDKALAFIVDEVGAYVAYSQERLEDLRAVVEQFGKESKNRIRAKKAIAPVWVIVTAQEKLDEVTSAMGDDRRILLAKVRDRFKHEIDLSPADIREVATRRVLSKTDEGEHALEELFAAHQGQLNEACRLERTSRRTELTGPDFAHFYPYLPHYVELSIDIMSGIRLQPGAMRHVGGSNRTIIGQIYQMLINPRTDLADKAVGTLVSLDKVYELIEGQVGSAKQKDISDIEERFKNDPTDHGWAARVAKAICLLEFVRDLPRTERNIAAALVNAIGQSAPLQEVIAALSRLESAQFVRSTEDGYKLQTAQEKNWTSERNSYLELKPRDRNEIKREILGEIFSAPAFKTYNYQSMRSFRVGITVDGMKVGDEGQIPLAIFVADETSDHEKRVEDARVESRLPAHQNDVYWVFALTADIDNLVAGLFASRQMIAKYDTMRAQGRITNDEAISLGNEKAEVTRIQSRLRDKISEALATGTGLFRGAAHDASALGKSAPEILKKLFDLTVPDLYPKLAIGARPLKGNEAEEVLKAANLTGLPSVFYAAGNGLGLVVEEGQKYVPNPKAEIAREVLDYLRHEQSYGNKVTGKLLEEHFSGIGYGWDRDVLLMVLAVLLRAGAIEVTYQGRRFRNHQDPQCRVPLTNTTAFRGAAFAPRESIDLKTLIAGVRNYEELTGDEVDVEEGAIATAFKQLAAEEMAELLPVIATVRANDLPVEGILEEYRNTLLSVQNAASDDCVRILAGEGASFKALRDQVRRIRDAVGSDSLVAVRRARRAAGELRSVLTEYTAEVDASVLADADALATVLAGEDFLEHLSTIGTLTARVSMAYRALYIRWHQRRFDEYDRAIEEVKGRPEWAQLTAQVRQSLLTGEVLESLLVPLSSRQCVGEKKDANGLVSPMPDILPAEAMQCVTCHATIGQMEADIRGLPGRKADVIAQMQQLVAPERRVVRVRAAAFFGGALTAVEDVNPAVERFSEELHKRLAEGATVIVE